MEVGPVDIYIIGFPGNKFTGRIAPAISELVNSGTIRILDLLFVIKDENGVIGTLAVRRTSARKALPTPRSRSPSPARSARRMPRSSTRTCRRTARRCSSRSRTPGRRSSSTPSRRRTPSLIDSIRIPVDVVQEALAAG